MKTKLSAALVGAAMIALGASAPTTAQSSYEQEVNRLLNATQSIASSRGFSSTHSRYNGQLRQGQEETITLDLNAGVSYMMVAQCDRDCSDIDLWLYDENGNLIDEDVLVDDTPIVNVTPIRNARFTLRARMISCSVQPCYYGIGAYGQR
ncbi:hypothetical protein [uncultured Erythrobacter sp.]|uniref:hypothetical protein n=1 Tax=uncultured Erythrobacter sp. TaxID=263913 RepID=UPI002624CB00|nr:hypothetical protein [uncultured Erythrobacter sp.]